MTDTAPAPKRTPARAKQPTVPWQLGVAVAVLLLYGILAAFMVAHADADSDVWDHRVVIFSSVEAIVFTAVGWVFGREVHRQTADAARADAQEAKADAKENATTAAKKSKEAASEREKGRAMAAAVQAISAASTGPRAGQSFDVGLEEEAGDASPSGPQLAALHALATKLYGDL